MLHICCAPCSIYPIKELKAKGHRIAGYFYNPNIHPYSEYLKRKIEVDKYSKESGVNVITGACDIEKFFQFAAGNEAPESRCPMCWWIRLQGAAKFAKENGFEAFTTTLLGSPYQGHDAIKEIGEDIARKSGVKFYYADFRIGFKEAQGAAKAKGIYRQNYCGCVFSEKERLEKKEGSIKGRAKKA